LSIDNGELKIDNFMRAFCDNVAEIVYLSSKENLILYLNWLIIWDFYLNLHHESKNDASL